MIRRIVIMKQGLGLRVFDLGTKNRIAITMLHGGIGRFRDECYWGRLSVFNTGV